MCVAQVWLPARAFVRKAIQDRAKVDDSGEIIRLETVCPWKEHLYELEEELAVEKPLKYCIYEVLPSDQSLCCMLPCTPERLDTGLVLRSQMHSCSLHRSRMRLSARLLCLQDKIALSAGHKGAQIPRSGRQCSRQL